MLTAMPQPHVTMDKLHDEVADALCRGLLTPADVAGLTHAELHALAHITEDALHVGDGPRALALCRTLVVLSPFWSLGWQMLARCCTLLGDGPRALWAHRAAQLLAPPAVAPPPSGHEETAKDVAPKSKAANEEATRTALILHDGRALPLRDTPAAVHHDTVTAKVTSHTLLLPENLTQTARIAWGREVTDTAIVQRAGRGAPARATPSVTDLQGDHFEPEGTSLVGKHTLERAAVRRRRGLSVTGTFTAITQDLGSADDLERP